MIGQPHTNMHAISKFIFSRPSYGSQLGSTVAKMNWRKKLMNWWMNDCSCWWLFNIFLGNLFDLMKCGEVAWSVAMRFCTCSLYRADTVWKLVPFFLLPPPFCPASSCCCCPPPDCPGWSSKMERRRRLLPRLNWSTTLSFSGSLFFSSQPVPFHAKKAFAVNQPETSLFGVGLNACHYNLHFAYL